MNIDNITTFEEKPVFNITASIHQSTEGQTLTTILTVLGILALITISGFLIITNPCKSKHCGSR